MSCLVIPKLNKVKTKEFDENRYPLDYYILKALNSKYDNVEDYYIDGNDAVYIKTRDSLTYSKTSSTAKDVFKIIVNNIADLYFKSSLTNDTFNMHGIIKDNKLGVRKGLNKVSIESIRIIEGKPKYLVKFTYIGSKKANKPVYKHVSHEELEDMIDIRDAHYPLIYEIAYLRKLHNDTITTVQSWIASATAYKSEEFIDFITGTEQVIDEAFTFKKDKMKQFIDSLNEIDKHDKDYVKYLHSLVDTISTVAEPYKLVVQDSLDNAKGFINVSDKILKLYKSNNPALNGELSNSEVFVHELLHGVMDVINHTDNAEIQKVWKDLVKLHEYIVDNLKPEDIATDSSKEAIAVAKRKIKYLKNDINEAIPYALTDKQINQWLAKQKIEKEKGNKTILDKLLGVIKKIFSIFTSLDIDNTETYKDLAENILIRTVAVKEHLYNNLNSKVDVNILNKLNRIVRDYIVKPAADLAGNAVLPNKLVRKSSTAKLVKNSGIANVTNYLLDAASSAIEENNKDNKFIGNVVNELIKDVKSIIRDNTTRTAYFKIAEKLNLLSSKIDAKSAELEAGTAHYINEMLDSLGIDHKKAYELLYRYDVMSIIKDDISDIDEYIKDLENRVGNDANIAKKYSKFMVNGYIGDEAIQPLWNKLNENGDLSKLATAYAIRDTGNFGNLQKMAKAGKEQLKVLQFIKYMHDKYYIKGYAPIHVLGPLDLKVSFKNGNKFKPSAVNIDTEINPHNIPFNKKTLQYIHSEMETSPLQASVIHSDKLNGKLGSYLIPIYNDNVIIDYAYPVEYSKIKSIVPIREDVATDIAKLVSREYKKEAAVKFNKQVIDILHELVDTKNPDRVKVTTEKDDKGKLQHIVWDEVSIFSSNKTIVDALSMLDTESLKNIMGNENGTLMVPKDIVDVIFGFRDISISSIMENKKAKKLARLAEKWIIDIATLTKSAILIKNPDVFLSNITSNLVQLVSFGVPIKYLVNKHKEAIDAIIQYNDLHNKVLKLKAKKAMGTITTNEEYKLKSYVKALDNNIMKKFMDKGLYVPSIEEFHLDEDTQNQLEMVINKHKDKIPPLVLQGLENLYLTDKTAYFKAVVNIIQYSDLIARYAYYDYLDKTTSMSDEEKLKITVDMFVNYENPEGRILTYLNKTGLVLFTKFLHRITRVLKAGIFKKPVSFLAITEVAEELGIDNIMEASPMEKNYDYIFHSPLENLKEVLDPPVYDMAKKFLQTKRNRLKYDIEVINKIEKILKAKFPEIRVTRLYNFSRLVGDLIDTKGNIRLNQKKLNGRTLSKQEINIIQQIIKDSGKTQISTEELLAKLVDEYSVFTYLTEEDLPYSIREDQRVDGDNNPMKLLTFKSDTKLDVELNVDQHPNYLANKGRLTGWVRTTYDDNTAIIYEIQTDNKDNTQLAYKLMVNELLQFFKSKGIKTIKFPTSDMMLKIQKKGAYTDEYVEKIDKQINKLEEAIETIDSYQDVFSFGNTITVYTGLDGEDLIPVNVSIDEASLYREYMLDLIEVLKDRKKEADLEKYSKTDLSNIERYIKKSLNGIDYKDTGEWLEVQTSDTPSLKVFQKEVDSINGMADIEALQILINGKNEQTDTLAHEYAHFYVRWFKDTPLVKQAIETINPNLLKDNEGNFIDSPEYRKAEEELVQKIGEAVVLNKGGEFVNWWEKFKNWMYNIFNRKQAKLVSKLADSFLAQ